MEPTDKGLPRRRGRRRLAILVIVLVLLGAFYAPLHFRRMDDMLVRGVLEGEPDTARTALRWGADAKLHIVMDRSEHADDPLLRFALRLIPFRSRPESTSGVPLIVAAARSGSAEVLDDLIAHGAGVDATAPGGRTALTLVAARRDPGPALVLLKAGANPKSAAPDGTPVVVLAARGSATALKEMLDRGAPAEAAAPDGWSALMVAAENGNDEAVRLLLSRGADPMAPRKVHVAGYSVMDPFLWAARTGCVPLLTAVWDRTPSPSERQAVLPAALALAASHGHEAAVRQLLDWGAPVNSAPAALASAAFGPPPAEPQPGGAGAAGGRPARPKRLPHLILARDAPLDPPLVGASRHGSARVVKLLLEHHANVEQTNAAGQTAIACAVQAGAHRLPASTQQRQVYDLLLGAGAKAPPLPPTDAPRSRRASGGAMAAPAGPAPAGPAGGPTAGAPAPSP